MEKDDTNEQQNQQNEYDDEFDYYYNRTLKINTKHGIKFFKFFIIKPLLIILCLKISFKILN
jgi:hypothetical protein